MQKWVGDDQGSEDEEDPAVNHARDDNTRDVTLQGELGSGLDAP
jgi:hypothetical protein